jgi:hypothetical protein
VGVIPCKNQNPQADACATFFYLFNFLYFFSFRLIGDEMTLDSICTVAVLGAGTMGNGIAHVFARYGYDVILRDVEESFLVRARDTIA